MRLDVEQGSQAGQSFSPKGDAIVVGRGRESDLLLSETGISRQHARLERGVRGWSIVDLGSTNGTLVNGQRLRPDQPYLLRPGDRIAMGDAVLVMRMDDAEGEWVDRATHEPRPASRRRPALLAVGAVALVAALVGIVILLVVLLQPEPEPATPTVAGPVDQIATAFPVPTEVHGVMTSIATILPTGFPLLLPRSTPTPEAIRPGKGLAGVSRRVVVPVSLPEPPAQVERGDVFP